MRRPFGVGFVTFDDNFVVYVGYGFKPFFFQPPKRMAKYVVRGRLNRILAG